MLHGKALCGSPGAPAFPQQTYQGTSSEWCFPWAKREVHTHQTSRGQGCWASSERRGCRGQGRELGRGEGDTNSKMNGLNFLCFMEANKRRQRGGEKRDLSACTGSHAHTCQPRPRNCWWPVWGGSLHPLGWHSPGLAACLAQCPLGASHEV